MIRITYSLLPLCLFVSSLFAQNEFKTKSVTLFKSGNGFFQKEAKIDASEGIFKIKENYPEASFGTLWFSSSKDQLESVTYQPDTLETEIEIQNRNEQIKLNTGKNVTLVLPDRVELTGVIEKVRNGYIEFKTDEKWRLISLNSILEIQFQERPIGLKKEKKAVPAIELKFSGKGKNEPLEMMYLNNQIGWFPNYKLVLKDDKTANLKFQAMIMNDAENIENAAINFVVGVPNFNFKHIPSIFAAEAKLMDVLRLFGVGNRNQHKHQFLSNAVLSQTVSSYGNSGDSGGSIPKQSGQQEDLFYYSLKNVSLKKGGRATYDIFETEIPIEHRYVCDLPDLVQYNQYRNGNQARVENHPVRHKICIENKGATPFTTGSVLIMNANGNEERPIAQSTLNFTSVGGDSKTDITIATDIRVNESLKDLERKSNEKNWNNRSWERVKFQGKVRIKNFKSKKVKMEISKTIIGEMLTTTVPWEIKNNYASYGNDPNPINDLIWFFEINPGEEKEIEYEYYIWKN